MRKLFAVSDIHGYLAQFTKAMQAAGLADPVAWSGGDSVLVVCGDSIDRGPHSRGVVNYLTMLKAQAQAAGGDVICLLGNHEAMVLMGPTNPQAGQVWWDQGGRECLDSYDIGRGSRYSRQQSLEILKVHKDWFLSLQSYHVEGDTLFVHGGPPPNRKLPDLEHVQDHLWITPEHFVARMDPEALMKQYGAQRAVFGHSPTRSRQPHPYWDGALLNIDTGSFLPDGHVTIVELLPGLAHRVAGSS